MKITRERLEAILREEIAAVAEDVRDYPERGDTMKSPPGTIGASRLEDEGEDDPGTEKAQGPLQKEGDGSDSPWPEKGNPFIKPSGKAQPKQSDPYASVHKANPFADPDAYKKELEKQRLQARDKASTGRAVPYSSSAQKLRAAKPIPLEENMFSNLKTNIDKVLRPGKYEDRSGAEFTAKRFNEAHELLAKAQQIINEFEPPLANKINVVAREVLKMRNQMLNEGVIQQEAPPVQNNQRARELLDGFKNMLKPEETAEPSACGTFLRQLADMADHESGTSDAGTMPNPLPNN